ncbi:MAG: NTP transferase domain-containing protein [Angelakisella sp.]
MNKTCGIILAAGDGKRMGSQGSKVLCQVLFKPMLSWVMENCAGAGVISSEPKSLPPS